MSHKIPTQAEIDHALLALGAGFKIEHQENDLMCSPAPFLVMRGPAITAATVEYLQANGLVQPTADENDAFEPSPDGMASYFELITKKTEEAKPIMPTVNCSEAFIAEGHGYYIPPPKRPAVPVGEFES